MCCPRVSRLLFSLIGRALLFCFDPSPKENSNVWIADYYRGFGVLSSGF